MRDSLAPFDECRTEIEQKTEQTRQDQLANGHCHSNREHIKEDILKNICDHLITGREGRVKTGQ
jgi:hypothetical protein